MTGVGATSVPIDPTEGGQSAHSSATAVLEAADRLERAAVKGQPCAPVRDLLGASDVDTAYAVQRELTRRRLAAGGRVVGRKIGLTSPAVQQQLGVDQPDFGVLFADGDASGWDLIPTERLLQPKVEAEIAFVLSADLADGDLDDDQVRAAVGYAVAALEIVDSRIRDWDITITDTVADNASGAMFVLGPERLSLNDFDPQGVQMLMFADDAPVSAGTGAACLGDPVNALSWLARTARALGDPLRAGQVVLSGALGPMVPVTPGVRVRAELSSLGPVRAAFSPASDRSGREH